MKRMKLIPLLLFCAAVLAGGSIAAYAADPCQNKAATGTGTVTTTQNTTTCTDQSPCGYVATYNPPNPAQQSCVTMTCKCCVWQSQQPYTQPFSCQPDPSNPGQTKCTGGARTYFGQPGFVLITVPCTGGQSNCDLCSETPNFFGD